MRAYVIERKTGEFVAKSGLGGSYVRDLQYAKKFPSKESAERNKCGDEHVVDVERLLDWLRC